MLLSEVKSDLHDATSTADAASSQADERGRVPKQWQRRSATLEVANRFLRSHTVFVLRGGSDGSVENLCGSTDTYEGDLGGALSESDPSSNLFANPPAKVTRTLTETASAKCASHRRNHDRSVAP